MINGLSKRYQDLIFRMLASATPISWLAFTLAIWDTQDNAPLIQGGAVVAAAAAVLLTVATFYVSSQRSKANRFENALHQVERALTDATREVEALRGDVAYEGEATRLSVHNHNEATVNRQRQAYLQVGYFTSMLSGLINVAGRSRHRGVASADKMQIQRDDLTMDLAAFAQPVRPGVPTVYRSHPEAHAAEEAEPAVLSNVVPLPHSKSFDLGRAFERKRLGLSPEDPETGTGVRA